MRTALLTGQRRTKVSEMRWADIEGDVWHMPKEKREKGVGGDLKLPALVMEIIWRQPRYASSPFVFTGRTGMAISGYSKLKRKFDTEAGITNEWNLHDLRRT